MRCLVLGAGGPAGWNTVKALDKAGHDVLVDDANPEHLYPFEAGQRWDGEEPADAIIPQPDVLVREVAAAPPAGVGLYLPRLETIDACQDKAYAGRRWYLTGQRNHEPLEVTPPWPDELNLAADELGFPFWLRAKHGAGANKAIKVERLDTAFHWIRFWDTREVEVDWIAEEFLPGRDLAWSSLWFEGELVACFLRERLEYVYPHLTPEGLTGTPSLARIVQDPTVRARAMDAVRAIDEYPHGIFSVDLKEDVAGVARPTEINAGRSFTTMGLWSLYGFNFTSYAARLAVEEPDRMMIDPLPDGLVLSRHLDRPAVFMDRSPVPA
jgi:carbamoyl-phosphate synthase large subunit